MLHDLPLIAGSASTVIFATSTVPMVVKAIATRNMRSYSLGSLILANIGNAIHSVYVFSLPFGPIWILHGFYLVVTAFMLIWFLLLESGLFRSGGEVTSHPRGASDRFVNGHCFNSGNPLTTS